MRSGILATVAIAACVLWAPAQELRVTLATVKYDGLAKLIEQHRGKVLYVDLWSEG